MAKSILLVKTSSLGDVIHVLPAISDIRLACAGASIDWVVEQPYSAVAHMHPAVSDVIPVAIRRWRGALCQHNTRDEIAVFLRRLRGHSYDAIVDAQGLFKSAAVALAARGRRYGLDFHSSREPLALFYHRTFRISWQLHAVERNRLLLAHALGYELPQHLNYGISAAPRRFDWLHADNYAVMLHATSGDYKLWPEQNWIALGCAMNASGTCCILPWGSEVERARGERIAAGMRAAIVPPALSLDDLAALFAGARQVTGVDTGLTHLAAALGVPTVGIFCATDPAATGLYGCPRAVNLGGVGQVPDVGQVMTAAETLST